MAEAMKSAEDMVAEADTGARQAGPFATKLIFAICIIWSLFQLYIASKLPGVMAQATGQSIFANIVAQARFVHLAFALTLATLAFPILGHKNKIPIYDWVLLAMGVSACGFKPVYRKGAASTDLRGLVLLPEAVDPISFAYRERLRRRFGDAGEQAVYLLENATKIEESGIAITQASDVTRYRVLGETEWRLVNRETSEVLIADTASAFTGFDATSSAFSVREARKAAEERLAIELAELTISAISAYLSENGAS